MKVNPRGVAFLFCILIAGFCFGGLIGLGVAAIAGAVLQVIF